MRFSPTQKNPTKLNAALVAAFVIGTLLYVLSSALPSGFPVPRFVFAALGVCCFVAGIFLLLRYRMTNFDYILRPRSDEPVENLPLASDGFPMPEELDLVVYKGMGSRPAAMECVLSLGDLVAVCRVGGEYTKKSAVAAKYQKDGFVFYDYTLTFLPSESVEAVFIDGSRYVGVILESGNEIADYLLKLKETQKENRLG